MMITRKTRFTSGLVAIIMLVTMLAAFVLPVTAEELDFPGVQQMETLGRDSTSDWGINTPADWRAAVALSKAGENFAGLTLHFTADIDFDENQDGTVDESEYVDTLVGNVEGEYVGFAGNIYGHDHVIKNLYIKHDIAVNGQYVGLIGFGSKKNVVIRDLGIESGKIYATGKGGTDYADENKMLYIGAFMGYSGNAITFANCWNGAEVYSDAHVYETDMATFGRLSAGTIINCFNTGDLTVMTKGATSRDGAEYATGGTARIMPFYDWGTASCVVKNSFNVGTLYGEGYSVSYTSLFSFGSGLDTDEEYQTIADVTKNVYSAGVSDFSNRSVDSYVTLSNFQTSLGDYASGKLASQLNANYDTTYDKDYGHKYYKVEDGKTVYAEDEYDAIFSLTLIKKLGDFVVETETSFYPATTVIPVPAFKNYELTEDRSWEILIDNKTNTFPMPPANVYMTFASTTPDWDLVARLIEKYSAYVETGHVATMAKEAEVYELLGKLETIYGMKDTLSADLAIKMIGQYAGEDLEFDLSPKEGLTYPNLPLARFYGSAAKGDWLIKDAADWRKAVELSNAGTSFSGVTFHFANDIDMKNISMAPMGAKTAFRGSIHGHGYAMKNLLVEHDMSDGAYAGWIARANSSGQVIRDVGLESGKIVVTDVDHERAGESSYAGIFLGYGSASITFANCWSGVDLIVGNSGDTKELTCKEIDVATFGRTGTLNVANCFISGSMTVHCTGTVRVDAIADWLSANEVRNDKGVLTGYTPTSAFSNFFSVADFNKTTYMFSMSNTYNTAKSYTEDVEYVEGTPDSEIDNKYHEEIKALREQVAISMAENAVNVYAIGAMSTNRTAATEVLGARPTIDEKMYQSGALAWLMNNNYDTSYDDAYGRQYYTVKNGQTVFGTKQEQPVKVHIKVDGELIETVYGVIGTPLSLGSFYDNCQVVESYAASVNAENELILNSLPDGLEMTVNAEFAAGLDYAKLMATIQEMEQIENKDEYTSNATTDSMEETLEKLQTKAYASQSEIDDAVALLNSYYRILDIKSVLECTDKTKMEAAYAVSTVKELEYLSSIRSWFGTEHVIYITADIDVTGWTADTYPEINGDVNKMEGLKASLDGDPDGNGICSTIKGLRVIDDFEPSATSDSAWLGDYDGAYVKNLNFVDCTATIQDTNYSGLLIQSANHPEFIAENLSFVECKTIAKPAGSDCETSKRDYEAKYKKEFLKLYKAKYEAVYAEEYNKLIQNEVAEAEAKTQADAIAYEKVKAEVIADSSEKDNIKAIEDTAKDSKHKHQCRTSMIAGYVTAGANATFRNIRFESCTLEHNSYGGNAGFLFGYRGAGNITISDIYLNNNIIGGKVSTSGVGVLCGEIAAGASGNALLQNIVVLNTKQEATNDVAPRALLVGSFITGKMSMKNVVTDNNGSPVKPLLHANDKNKLGTLVSYEDIYSDATVIFETKGSTVANVTKKENTAEIASGKAAWTANAEEYKITWSTVDGKIVPSTTGLPSKVTFDFTYNEDVNLYTDSTGKLIGLTSAITDFAWDGYADLNNAVFAADTVIKQAVCAHTYSYTFNGTDKHTVKCTKNCGYEELQDCTMESQVGNGTTHKKVCAVCTGEVAEACAKVMSHIYGTYDAESKHSEVCTICGYASAEAACSFTEEEVEHTDSMNGYTRNTCACGYYYDEIESKKVHVWDTENKTVLKDNTNGEDGLAVIPCKHCSAVEYETITAEVITDASIVLKSDAPYSKLPGEKFEVDVLMAQNPGVNGIALKIEYDSSVLKLTENDILDQGKFSNLVKSVQDGEAKLHFINWQNVTDAELPLVTLTFEVLDAAKLGVTDVTATLIKDENNPVDTGVSNYAGENVAVKDAAAKVEIVGNLWADVNGDGLVNTSDATMILKWKVGNTFTAEEFDVKAADADRNGIVEIADAVMVLQYAAGMVEWDPNGTTVAPATL